MRQKLFDLGWNSSKKYGFNWQASSLAYWYITIGRAVTVIDNTVYSIKLKDMK